MKKVRAKSIEKPFLLSAMAKHFGLNTRKVTSKLSNLAKEGKVFSHDLERLKGGDYRLSAYALVLLLTEREDDPDPNLLRSLADYMESVTGKGSLGGCLAANYMASRILRLTLQCDFLEKEADQIKSAERAMDLLLVNAICKAEN